MPSLEEEGSKLEAQKAGWGQDIVKKEEKFETAKDIVLP